jgi:cyclase
MFRNAFPARRGCVIGLLAMVFAAAVSAQGHQDAQPPANAASGVTLTTDLVKTGLYVISGGGSNTLMRLSASGLILVDGKLPGNYRPLMSQVRKINKLSDLPTRVLVLTDHHENHAGTNAQFQSAGIVILAQENTKRRLPAYQPDVGRTAPPVVSFDREYKLKLGGVEVDLMHFGKARTDGDTVVYFPGLKVVAVGDLFTPGTPEPDFLSGGSLVGWAPVLDLVLKLDFDVVVPGSGPLANRADLQAFKTRIEGVVARASALVKQGVARDQLMARLNTDDLGWRFNFTGEQLDRLYAELSQP